MSFPCKSEPAKIKLISANLLCFFPCFSVSAEYYWPHLRSKGQNLVHPMAFTVSMVSLPANNTHSALSSSSILMSSSSEVVSYPFNWQNRPFRWWRQHGKGWTLIFYLYWAGERNAACLLHCIVCPMCYTEIQECLGAH